MTESQPVSLADLLRKLLSLPLVRFGVVGASNAAVGFGTFWSALHVMRAAFAQAMAYAVGTAWSYYWNRRWTFESSGAVAGEATRFVSLQAGFLLFSSGCMGFFVDRHHLPAGPTWLAVMFVVTVLNFVLSRYWAFRKD